METENAVLKKSEDHYFEEASKKKKMMNMEPFNQGPIQDNRTNASQFEMNVNEQQSSNHHAGLLGHRPIIDYIGMISTDGRPA